MSTVTKPILLDETGQEMIESLNGIREAIAHSVVFPINITVTQNPTKTVYIVGETLDLSGLVVKVGLSNNQQYDITEDCSYSITDGSVLSDPSVSEIVISWTWIATGQIYTTRLPISINIALWTNGTDADIAKMLNAHYAGDISIYDYWTVGDERVVQLSAMEATDVGESHAAQEVVFVLTNAGGKMLSDGETECAFQVDQKDCLIEIGYMNSLPVNSGGWKQSARRTWCNSVYRAAIPSSIRELFKSFINQSSVGGSTASTVENTTDYFALRAGEEVFGWNSGTVDYLIAGEGDQVKYYETESHWIKEISSSYPSLSWWSRSARKNNGATFVTCRESIASSDANYDRGIAPFGVI